MNKRAESGSERRPNNEGWRNGTVIVLDLLAWVVGLTAARTFYEFPFTGRDAIVLTFVAMAVHLLVGIGTGLYRGHFRPFSFDEAGAVAITSGTAGAVLLGAEYLLVNEARGGQLVVVASSLTLCLMAGHRYVRRLRARRIAAHAGRNREPIIIYGAGEGAQRAISSMETAASSRFRPAAIIDDNPNKRKVRIGGVKVEGTNRELAQVARRHGATSVLLAMPSASGRELRVLHRRVKAAGLETHVMPPVQRLVGDGSPREISRYTDEEVLQRGIVDIDYAAVADMIQGSRVLVTGAGGSIGSELVRQLATYGPESLIALDRDDSLLQGVIASIEPEHRGVCVAVLADIRDIDRLDDVFTRHEPHVVFHAAALKHVDALEGAPSEGWKTNVLGSTNVVNVAERHGVERVVNISTDKAANPANVLGYTKRIAERVTADAARRTGRTYVSVRFGNVIGSRGSALETFQRQINEGGPVTVTHPDMTRYFMAVREAVRLTMQAATIGRSGEVLVLDMGTPMSVLEVARQLIDRSGKDVDIIFTGIRPGEKMHETLISHGETADRPFHPMIDHVDVTPLAITEGLDACASVGLSAHSIAGLEFMAGCDATVPTDNINRAGTTAPRAVPLRRDS